MKFFSRNPKTLFALFLSCLLLTGCNDDDPVDETPDPTITAINPSTGPVGTQVEITGSNFGATLDDHVLTFNGAQATINSVSNNRIIAIVPNGATTGLVSLSTRGTTVSGPEFIVTEEGPETTVTSINPTEGPSGTEVTIAGTGFGDELTDQEVHFGGVSAEITALNSDTITALVPVDAALGTNVVTVTVGGTTFDGPEFTVTEVEKETGITSIAPTSGPVGTEVSIIGNGFGDAQSDHIITFNGVEAEISSVTDNEITAVVPATATTGPVSLSMGGNTFDGPNFTVTQDATGIHYGGGFSMSAPITFNGQGGLKQGLGINGETILRLTPAKSDRTTAAFFNTEMPVVEGFETTFDFRISRPGKPEGVETPRGADGFAFIIQNEGLNAMGNRGPDKGYGGIRNAVVVDFDIHKNEEDGDPNGNHVSIQVSKGQEGFVHADANYRLALASSDTFPDMPVSFITDERGSHTARVVYTPGTADTPGLLQVWIDDMAEPMEAELNLEEHLKTGDGTAFVGFTGSTSHVYGWAAHDILSWTFQPTTSGGE